MNIKTICKILALSYVDNFDVESERITICGFSCYHGHALVADYFDSGVPNVHVVSFNPDDFDDLLCANSKITVALEELPNPLVHSYDNALKLFLLAAGSDLHTITLLGFPDSDYMYGSDFSTYSVDRLHDLLDS